MLVSGTDLGWRTSGNDPAHPRPAYRFRWYEQWNGRIPCATGRCEIAYPDPDLGCGPCDADNMGLGEEQVRVTLQLSPARVALREELSPQRVPLIKLGPNLHSPTRSGTS